MPLTHATLTVEGGSPIEVMYNPTEYSISRGVQYAEVAIPGLQVPLLQFVRGEAQTLSVELFLDGTEDRAGYGTTDVEARLEALRGLVTIVGTLHAPPIVTFQWGGAATGPGAATGSTTPGNTFISGGSFKGVVTAFTEKFVLFSEAGRVERARVTLQIKRFETPEAQRTALSLRSPDRTKTHVVRDGDALWRIADKAYGDPELWRLIAATNGIERPNDIRPGQVLVLPALA